jgi:hypothetical protein
MYLTVNPLAYKGFAAVVSPCDLSSVAPAVPSGWFLPGLQAVHAIMSAHAIPAKNNLLIISLPYVLLFGIMLCSSKAYCPYVIRQVF